MQGECTQWALGQHAQEHPRPLQIQTQRELAIQAAGEAADALLLDISVVSGAALTLVSMQA